MEILCFDFSSVPFWNKDHRPPKYFLAWCEACELTQFIKKIERVKTSIYRYG